MSHIRRTNALFRVLFGWLAPSKGPRLGRTFGLACRQVLKPLCVSYLDETESGAGFAVYYTAPTPGDDGSGASGDGGVKAKGGLLAVQYSAHPQHVDVEKENVVTFVTDLLEYTLVMCGVPEEGEGEEAEDTGVKSEEEEVVQQQQKKEA